MRTNASDDKRNVEQKENIEKNNERNYVHLIAGSLSGTLAAAIVQPLDVIKTRQQQFFSNLPKSTMRQLQYPELRDGKYRNTLYTMRTIFTEEGFFAFWKGTGPTMYRVIPGAGLYFFFLHNLIELLRTDSTAQLSAFRALTAGFVSRMLVSSILHPISVVKTRFEGLGTGVYRSTLHALRTIATTEGVRGLHWKEGRVTETICANKISTSMF